MESIEQNLKRYLELESLLNDFFSLYDYCASQCVAVEMRNNGNKPVCACCTRKYYAYYDLDHPAFERLREERERRFGKPADHVWENPVSPCEYHNPQKGCILTTHKSPVCVSFFCPNGIDFLRKQHGIYTYDYLGIYNALEWILTGEFPETQYVEFRKSLLDMIRKGRSGSPAWRKTLRSIVQGAFGSGS